MEMPSVLREDSQGEFTDDEKSFLTSSYRVSCPRIAISEYRKTSK